MLVAALLERLYRTLQGAPGLLRRFRNYPRGFLRCCLVGGHFQCTFGPPLSFPVAAAGLPGCATLRECWDRLEPLVGKALQRW